MKHSFINGNLQRVFYSVFVIALIACAVYVFAIPATSVEAQKFETKQRVDTQQLATATFPTNAMLPLAIPDNSAPGVNASIPVSGLTDQVRGVALNISFDNLDPCCSGHTWMGDLIATLTEPGANSHVLFAITGDSTAPFTSGDSSDVVGPYTFGDGTTGDWWTTAVTTVGGTIAPGSYRTHSIGSAAFTDMNPVFQGPALADSGAPFENAKKSGLTTKTIPVNPPDNLGNGTWTLNISDNAIGDTGRISALSLTITTLAPTAAFADIRGGVQTAKGRPIRGAFVTILNTETNETFTVQTGTFGKFSFEGLPVGSFYTMWVEHGRYQFNEPLQAFTLESDIGNAVFIGTN